MAAVTIVDYGMGNLGSIRNMLKKVGATDALITGDPTRIAEASRIILPGVGHFKRGMENIRAKPELVAALNHAALTRRVPTLGICLGAQLVTSWSEEGDVEGLGWIPARTKKFHLSAPLKIPHMGWREVTVRKDHPLLASMPQPARFYFVHSYYMEAENAEDVLLTAHYGHDFAAGLQHQNIMALQFHPEKSHRFGMQILKQFVGLDL
jgi:glutamine amidotransferase